jgi:hypothetical protein
MPVIRHEQMEELNRRQAEKFEDRMVEHLRETFPEPCQEMGEDALREDIRYGMDRAESYGIESEQDVCNYVNLMMALGRDFDTDRPWARRILTDPDVAGPAERIDALYDEAEGHLEQEAAAEEEPEPPEEADEPPAPAPEEEAAD